MTPYRVIPMDEYPRRRQFAYFSAMSNPYVGVTVDVDITAFLAACRKRERPFFLSFVYCVGRAVNAVPQLRQRIRDGETLEYAFCDTSHTVLCPDETYGYCRLNCMQPFRDYLPRARALHEQAKSAATLDDGEDALSLIYLSSLPWVRYTQLYQPTPTPPDSNPRVTWGQYREEAGRVTLPVTLLVNHALADGLHIGRFYDALHRELEAFLQLP